MKQKIKLVHIISILQLGGAESVLASLIDQLGSDEYEHHVIYFHAGPTVERIQQRGIATYQIRGAIALCDPLFWIRLTRCIKRIQPDLIHTHLWAANLSGRIIGKILGIPVVNTIHNKLVFQGAFRNAIDYVSLPLADSVVGCGPVVTSTRSKYPIDVKKIVCISNGIDAHAIRERAINLEESRSQFGWSHEHIVIGTVGRFEDQKNYHTLLTAFARVHAMRPETRLLMVGGGSLEASLKDHARLLGVSHVVQFVVGKSAYGYFPMMDIFSLASHYEGLSIALLEAISCGIPCITTANNGTHELIHPDVTGILVEKPDVDSIEMALMEYVVSPENRIKMSTNARALVCQEYSLSKMTREYTHVYATLLQKYSSVKQ